MGLGLHSTGFTHGGPLPARFARAGGNVSPQLRWSAPPAGVKSFVLVAEDRDAAGGKSTHWLVYDIPPEVSQLVEGDARVGVAGRNDFQFNSYGGPDPPPRHGRHRYFFRVYALDVETLGLPAGAAREAVEAAMAGHVLDRGELMGTYETR